MLQFGMVLTLLNWVLECCSDKTLLVKVCCIPQNDGGNSWEKANQLGVQGLNKIFRLNDQDIYIAGTKGTLLSSHDGGLTFRSSTVGGTTSSDYNLIATAFEPSGSAANPTNGFVVTQSGIVFTTANGGMSWEPTSGAGLMTAITGFGQLQSVEAVSYNLVYALVKSGTGRSSVFKSDGDLDVWTQVVFDPEAMPNTVYSNGTTKAWAGLSNGIVLDLNNEQIVPLPTTNAIEDIAMVGEQPSCSSKQQRSC